MARPTATETAPVYYRYIDLIPDEDVVAAMEKQLEEMYPLLKTISEEKSLHSYAPGKWTIRQLLNHVNDGERVFLYRALWFARKFPEPLPGFDQDVGVAGGDANNVSWSNLVEEFRNIRVATISFFKNLTEDAWLRTGIASDNPFTVRALAYIIAGHVAHHRRVIEERYLN